MKNLMIFTRRNTTDQWRYIASRLTFAKEVTIVGLLDDGCDVNLMPSFYSYYRNRDSDKFALSEIGTQACEEIIQRCRLLRNTDRNLALKLIGAMWQAMSKSLDLINPDLLLSFMVDFYAVDILDRLIKQRNIPSVPLGGSILKNHLTITDLDQHRFIREPEPAEIDQALKEIMSATFAPSVVTSKKYDFARFLKTKLTWHARHVLLSALKLSRRDYLNPEYMLTPKLGDDYYVRWQDWKVTRYMNAQWEDKLNSISFEKRVFVGLQYYPEASTDYCVGDVRLTNCIASATEIARVLTSKGFTIFLKDHPVMFGLRRTDIYESLSQFAGVVFVPYEVKSKELIDRCKTTLTWTGTIGIEAAFAGRCSVVSTPYYRTDNDFVHFATWEDIASLPERIDKFEIPVDLDGMMKRVIYQICSSSIPANPNWGNFNSKISDLSGTQVLIDSLNRYVPEFARKSKTDAFLAG